MRFTKQVVEFNFAGIPVIGNLDNGYVIGLSKTGQSLCKELFRRDVSEDEIASADNVLFDHLRRGNFFETHSVSLSSAYLHITDRCNLDCVGCYSYSKMRNKLMDPTLRQLQRAIAELSRNGVRNLILSGGEPFLRNDLLQIVSYTKTSTSIEEITIATNGAFINQKMIAEIADYVDLISVSIDAPSEHHKSYIRQGQSFSKTIEAIESIQHAGISCQILPTLHSKNICYVNDYVTLATGLKTSLNYSLYSVIGDNEYLDSFIPDDQTLCELGRMAFLQGVKGVSGVRDAPIGLNLSVRRSCGAAKGIISVAANGDVYPCHMMHQGIFLLGNIYSDSLKDILNSKSTLEVRNTLVGLCQECQDCQYVLLCGGGCKARAYSTTESSVKCDSYCSMYQTFYADFENHLKGQLSKKEV